MSLEQKDIELIDRLLYKNNDDLAASVARSFERLEERIDAAETRIYSRLADIEEKVERGQDGVVGEFIRVKGRGGELVRGRELARELAIAE